MKPFLAVVGGFVASLGMFAIGIAVAAIYLTASPMPERPLNADVSDIWTAEPRPVDKNAQPFQRVAAAPTAVEPVQQADAASGLSPETAASAVDATQTSSLRPGAAGALDESAPWDPEVAELQTAHVEWCADQYRSYNPVDNNYRTYSGQIRSCVSPYSDELSMRTGGTQTQSLQQSDDQPARLQYASDTGFAVDADHVNSCLSRYRSYSPEDNSYQPYGGGPRRQCE